jgi:HNH endonuclease
VSVKSIALKKERKKAYPWIEPVIDYWEKRVCESNMGCDWDEAHKRCWRCGVKARLQRCHIIPEAAGGTTDPSNIIALCAYCHDEAPDVTDPTVMWEWLKTTRAIFHDTYWYEKAFAEAFPSGVPTETVTTICAVDEETFTKTFQQYCGFHWNQHGSGCVIKHSTRTAFVRHLATVAATLTNQQGATAEP